MKREIIAIVFLLLVGILFSCESKQEKSSGNISYTLKDNSNQDILRGRDLSTNVITPIYVDKKDNIYKIGDTVWVWKETNTIQIRGVYSSLSIGNLPYSRAVVIEQIK